jgi:predicted nucleic acid-binding protein
LSTARCGSPTFAARGRRRPPSSKLRPAANRFWSAISFCSKFFEERAHEAPAARTERVLRRFDVVPLLDGDLAPCAARNYPKLRDLGVTVRKTADIVIGTFCIERRCALLHDDRDFAPMEEHLGLVGV